MSRILKISVATGLITAGIIILYEISNLLLVYHYFTYEYYITGIAVVALGAGFILAGHFRKTGTGIGAGKLDSLTSRELRVLKLISEGRSNKEIAALNYVELSTVKTHINNIYCKLAVKNRKDAAAIYQKAITMQKSTLSPPTMT